MLNLGFILYDDMIFTFKKSSVYKDPLPSSHSVLICQLEEKVNKANFSSQLKNTFCETY